MSRSSPPMLTAFAAIVLVACTLLPAPTPTPTAAERLVALAGTCWELDRVLENGENKPPFDESQSVQFFSNARYLMYDGCNTWCCERYEEGICEMTLAACFVQDIQTGEKVQMTGDQEFVKRFAGMVAYEIRDGHLWWFYGESDALVFRPAEDCTESTWCARRSFER